MVEEYKSNSHKSREQQDTEKKIESVVSSGSATVKKRSEAKKVADVFIQEDIQNVKSHILMDVLVPAIKKALSDIVKDGIDMMLYGEAGRSKNNSPTSRINYRNYYSGGNDRRDRAPVRRDSFDYGDIEVSSRGEAEAILDAMNDIIAQYGIASVSDLYDLAGIDDHRMPPYTMNKYGWSNIAGAKAVRTRDGYELRLPRAMPIDY